MSTITVAPFEPFRSHRDHTLCLTTPELRRGDVVHTHGMLCLIDSDPILSVSHPGNQTFYVLALVLNRVDVPATHVPMSFTTCTLREEHRWTIQGNEHARWMVTR